MRDPQSNYRMGKVSVELRGGVAIDLARAEGVRVRTNYPGGAAGAGVCQKLQDKGRLNEERPPPAAVTPPESHSHAAHQSLLVLSSNELKKTMLLYSVQSGLPAKNWREGLSVFG